ncbi:MAG: ABC transporter ATP-binding protein/permease [Defluviitaleaceae bacterium]|nr:ABC transporter ATP-binding protein/permease [Defluviitaleaceae bacterium]
MKKQKEKPIYSTGQNTAYILRNTWAKDSKMIWMITAQIILTVAIATTAIFLPATVVEQITSGVSIGTLVITILLFTIALALMHAVNSYIGMPSMAKRMFLRSGMCFELLKKVISTDYANLEEKRFTDSKQKALDNLMNNSASPEAIYITFTQLGTNILGFGVYILLLAAINPFVMVVTASTAVFGVVARHWANKWRHANDDLRAAPGKRLWYVGAIGNDSNMGKDIRLFGIVNWVRDVFDANLQLSYSFHRRANIRQFIADIVEAVAAFVREGIAYAYLIWLVIGGDLSAEGFVLMFAAVGGFSGYLMGILFDYAKLVEHSFNICRIREFFEYPEKFIREEGEAISHKKGQDYSLELKNVSFRYDGAEANALENINLRISPGEKLAVVGLNGAGKTTMIKLLCGFYDPTEGQVLINGQDIKKYNREDYYRLFTAVFQDFNILPITIADNLTGEPENQIDKARMDNCIHLAGFTEKIASLPGGATSLLRKDVYPDGTELSGGETQRLMLARALYKDAPLLILDEPTAALDPIAESQLYERYNELSHGRTSVYISHRLASTRFCNRIILIDNKTIAEEGTHDSLISKGGKYAELFDIQSKYYQEGDIIQ